MWKSNIDSKFGTKGVLFCMANWIFHFYHTSICRVLLLLNCLTTNFVHTMLNLIGRLSRYTLRHCLKSLLYSLGLKFIVSITFQINTDRLQLVKTTTYFVLWDLLYWLCPKKEIETFYRKCREYEVYTSFPKKMQNCSTKSDIKNSVGLARMNLSSIWFDRWMEENSRNNHGETILKNWLADDEKSDKILEIDTGNPHPLPKRGEQIFMPFESLSRRSTKSQKPNTALPTVPALSLMSLNFPQEIDQAALWTAVSSPQVPSISSRPGSSYRRGPENSPRVHSVSSRPGSSNRRGPFTPAKSECSRSLFGEYLSYPNYMANTESSRAKFRSHSAPRQRMEFEKPGSTKMFVRGFWDVDTSNSDKGSTLLANSRSKGHPAYSSSNYGSRC